MKKTLLLFGALVLTLAAFVYAQTPQQPGSLFYQLGQSYYYTIPISSTAAVAAQTTLTIPAPPPGLYNYVCFLHFNASQNGTATASTNAVTTSTNFNSYAIKYSLAATANLTYDWVENWGGPATGGCAKSTSPATATTFVSPALQTNTAFTWTALYFQAP